MQRAAFTWLPVFLAFLACERAPTGPEACYRAFHAAISDGDWDGAVVMLTPEARTRFERVGAQLAVALDEEVPDPLAFFLRGVRAEVVGPLREVTRLDRGESGRATLKVVAGDCELDGGGQCVQREVHLRELGGRWLIEPELPDSLGKASRAPVKGVEK
ncbi:MAG: hypothetical protein JXR96_13265 [Deltaproteobacteria bacterium]|nr:hypothetical protein [Deltaproteobacteria bacterium]